MIETSEIHSAIQSRDEREDHQQFAPHPRPLWKRWPSQFMLFGSVGVLNTLLDVLLLNGLLWLFPTTNTPLVLFFNSLAYGIGALNSFFLNKYLTFGSRQKATWSEVQRFILTTLLGIACNDLLIWLANILFHSYIAHSSLGMNIAKIFAIAGTVFVSYFGMRLWVFAKKPHKQVSHPMEEISENADKDITTHTPTHLEPRLSVNSDNNTPIVVPSIRTAIPTRKLHFLNNGKIKKVQLVNNGSPERVANKKTTAALQRV